MISIKKIIHIANFAAGGIIGLGVDLIFLKTFLYFGIFTQLTSVTVAFLISLCASFSYQRFVTYRSTANKNISDFVPFVCMWLLLAMLNTILVKIFTSYSGTSFTLHAQVFSSIIISLISFVLYRTVIFVPKNKNFFTHVAKFVKKNKAFLETLVLIFLLAFMVRAGLLFFIAGGFGDDALVMGDGARYVGNALTLLENGTFSYEGLPETYRIIGYSVFISVGLAAGLPLALISLLQIFISSFIPVFVFVVGRKLGMKRGFAFGAAIFACLEPVQVFYSVVFFADVFYTVLTFGALSLFYYWHVKGLYSYIIGSAFLIGLSNYLRPANLYLPIFLSVFYIFYLFIHKSISREKFFGLCILVSLSFSFLLPWYMRNYLRFDAFEFVSAKEVNGFNYNAVSIKAVSESKNYEEARVELMKEFEQNAPVPNNQKDFKNMEYMKEKTREIILANKKIFIKNYLLGLNTFLFSGNYHYMLQKFGIIEKPNTNISFSLLLSTEGVMGLLKGVENRLSEPYTILAIAGKIFWIGIVFLSLLGAAIRKSFISYIFLVLVLYFSITIASVTIGVEARHRYVLNPLIFIFAFVMLEWIYDRFICNYSAIQRRRGSAGA